MVRVPRSGTHEGIKYNKKRTLVRICPVCKSFFEIIGSKNASKKFCSNQCKKINNTDYQSYWYNQLPIEKRNEINNNRERNRGHRTETENNLRREFRELGLKYRGE